MSDKTTKIGDCANFAAATPEEVKTARARFLEPTGQTGVGFSAKGDELLANVSKVKWPVVLEDSDFTPRQNGRKVT